MNSHSIDTARTTNVDQRVVTDARRAEDGWHFEVADQRGVRLTYWIADAGCVPRVGDIACFHGGALGQPIVALDINDCRVY